jgi:prenyltransferase beta subunit
VSWQAASFVVLVLVLIAGAAWYERDRPPARVLSLVATLAALAVVGRLAFAAVPNVKPTTDIVLFAGYALGAVPGFAVGAVTALVSNVFLSQGPWTPWQMVGWGAVGVAGAALARTLRDREPNRLLLAAVCGVAGLAFGAWMDLYQTSLAARQDLDTYLAVAATSLPYNIAHAIGNVVFCLLIGPVFIRALRRYRRRFEVRWKAPVVAGAALALLLALPAGAAAAPADRAERWLLRVQNADGGFGPAPGAASSQLYSGWTGLGLAAAGRHPSDVRRGGRSLTAYVTRNGRGLRDIGEIERTVLLLEAAGLSARSFAGRDLIAPILSRRRGDGSIAGYVSYTAFGVLALRAAGEPVGKRTVAWLTSAQNGDGGFGLAASSPSDSDITGAALQALATVGRARGATARRAVEWLRANQNDDGGYGQFRGRSSNAQSTSYAIQGLLAARAAEPNVARALAYLRGLQRPNGSVAYSSSSTQTPVWVTAQALMAFEREPLPVASVQRRAAWRSAASSEEASATASPPAPEAGPDGGPKAEPRPAAPSAGAAPSSGTSGAAARAMAAMAKHEAERSMAAGEAGRAAAGDPGAGLDRARASAGQADDDGPPAGIVAAGLAATLGVLILLRRRLVPGRPAP